MEHTIQNRFLRITVSEQGAELRSILGADGTEYLWQGDPAYWSDRALNIFPYVARLTDGCYELDGSLHRMQIHGIAPYKDFTLIYRDEIQMTFELAADAQTHGEYPRDFRFRIRYALAENVLRITYEVENRDSRTMYFGLGGHPGFNVPLTPGRKFEDYRLRFREICSPERIGFTEDCFLNGEDVPFPLQEEKLLPLSHDLFDDDAIVLRNICREVTLESEGDPHSVTVRFPGMPYLGLWHWPKTDAPYICLEPWCSLPSSAGKVTVFEQQPDLLRLAPGQSYENVWTIEMR